jgi:hypothetical protein
VRRVSEGRLDTLLERIVSDDVRVAARCNGPGLRDPNAECAIALFPSKVSEVWEALMNPSRDTAHVWPKAFSNIRIQDANTFLCAENAMNAQARESVCHGKNCIVAQKVDNVKIFSFRGAKFRHPNHRIGAHPPLARITPYPTGRLFWGALSQALRAKLRSHRSSGTFCNSV